MAHIPINHPLRPVYRVLSGLVGLYVLVFGIVGYIQTSDRGFFNQHGDWVLLLRTNPAFSVLSIIAGIAVLGAALIGRNLFAYVNLAAGIIFLAAGMAMMALLQTDANILAFSMVTCILSFIFGMIFLAAGLYGKVGTVEEHDAEEAFRHAGAKVG
jgi:Domain of unknown function (DUF4383)